jgi:carboxylesterase type B
MLAGSCTPSYWAAMRIASDWSFTCPNRRAARWLAPSSSAPKAAAVSVSGAEASVWLYVFNHLTDLGEPPAPFAFVPHASQRAYVFGDTGLFSTYDKLMYGAQALSATMGAYWTNMARLGQPDGADGAGGLLPTWPRYSNATDVLMVLDSNVSTEGEFRKGQCDFMDKMLLAEPR